MSDDRDAELISLQAKLYEVALMARRLSCEWRYHAEFGHEPTALGHGDTYNRAICDCVANECVAKAQQ